MRRLVWPLAVLLFACVGLSACAGSPEGVTTLTVGSPVTADEKWVDRVYRDFVLRPATASELSSGAALVASSSPQTFIEFLLSSDAFLDRYISAQYGRYLYRWPTSSEMSDAKAGISATGDLLAVESHLIASSEYFEYAGNTDADFIHAVIVDVLFRQPTSQELIDYGATLANTGDRETLALEVLRSPESNALRVRGIASQVGCLFLEWGDPVSAQAGLSCIILDQATADGSTWIAELAADGQYVALAGRMALTSTYWDLSQA